MKLSLNWLKEYIDIKEDPQTLANLITLHIAEVEEIDEQAKHLQHIVIGEVLEAKKHPDADNLNIGKFDVGEDEPRQIVFGGKAILNPGDRLPVALPGAKIGDITIEKRKLRGELSQGMCCLNSEINILNGAEEIHLFTKDDPANGTPVSEALNLNDVIIDIDNKTLTHRSDLFNHIGFARELSVVLNTPLTIPDFTQFAEQFGKDELSINIKDPEGCHRYLGAVLNNIIIGPSPDWMQERLVAVGVKVINNVVDITNYVMYEFGQPLHAFDYDKVDGKEINVRRAKKGEALKTLDGKDRKLEESMLVIADSKRATALAGIMGGTETEVNDRTTSIILESAQFDGVTIRTTAQTAAARTDGSTRHEKGLGRSMSTVGFWRAVDLLQKYAGATISSEVIDVGEAEPEKTVVVVDLDYINRLIGVDVPVEDTHRWLVGLGFKVVEKDDSMIEVTVPLWRTDIHNHQDIVEEVARMYGYDKVAPQPLLGTLEPPFKQSDFHTGQKLIHWLAGLGAMETYNYSFYSEQDINNAGLEVDGHIEILNPMNPQQQYLRQTLLVNILQVARRNLDNHQEELLLSEYGHVYFDENEFPVVGIAMTGDDESVFYRLKGVVESLLAQANINAKLRIITEREESANAPFMLFDPLTDVRYVASKKHLITMGVISSRVAKKFGIEKHLAYAEIHLPRFSELMTSVTEYQKINAYPSLDLDISIEVENAVTWKQIQSVIQDKSKDLLQNTEIFDVYTGDKVADNHKSLGIRFVLAADNRTLEMKEAEQIRENIVKELRKQYNAKHRY